CQTPCRAEMGPCFLVAWVELQRPRRTLCGKIELPPAEGMSGAGIQELGADPCEGTVQPLVHRGRLFQAANGSQRLCCESPEHGVPCRRPIQVLQPLPGLRGWMRSEKRSHESPLEVQVRRLRLRGSPERREWIHAHCET